MKIKPSKPSKTLYPNQKEIEKNVLENLGKKYFSQPFVKKIYLLGSLAEGKFGVYDTPYQPLVGSIQHASDVDLIIIGDESFQVPKDWTKEDNFIFELYHLGPLNDILGIKNKIHKVSAFVYKKSLENLPPANKFNLTGDVFDMSTRKEALEFWLKTHKNKLWYEKK